MCRECIDSLTREELASLQMAQELLDVSMEVLRSGGMLTDRLERSLTAARGVLVASAISEGFIETVIEETKKVLGHAVETMEADGIGDESPDLFAFEDFVNTVNDGGHDELDYE